MMIINLVFSFLCIEKLVLKDCTNPVTLNKIVNKERIDTSGLNTSYEKECLDFIMQEKWQGLVMMS